MKKMIFLYKEPGSYDNAFYIKTAHKYGANNWLQTTQKQLGCLIITYRNMHKLPNNFLLALGCLSCIDLDNWGSFRQNLDKRLSNFKKS